LSGTFKKVWLHLAFDANPEKFRLRPHHIFYDRFLPLDDLIRGEEFARAVDKIKELTQSESNLIISVTEGPDHFSFLIFRTDFTCLPLIIP
jgi:hypothetical protein